MGFFIHIILPRGNKKSLCKTCYYKRLRYGNGIPARCIDCMTNRFNLYIQESTYKGIGIPLDAPLGFQIHGRYLSDGEKKICGCSVCERELKGEIL